MGVQRCGTTWLRRVLDAHPDVEMAHPERPEPKYFIGRDPGPDGVAEYLATHFGPSPARVRGEKGTSYLDHPESWPAMLRAFPEARFVVILRDPVARAVSHWRFSTAHGLEHLPAEEALADPALEQRPFDRAVVSTSPFAYLSRGLYAASLARLFGVVGRERVAVVFLEEVCTRPRALDPLWAFLGVEPLGAVPAAPVNCSGSLPVPEAVAAHLASYYAEPNRHLADLLGRPLPRAWRHTP